MSLRSSFVTPREHSNKFIMRHMAMCAKKEPSQRSLCQDRAKLVSKPRSSIYSKYKGDRGASIGCRHLSTEQEDVML